MRSVIQMFQMNWVQFHLKKKKKKWKKKTPNLFHLFQMEFPADEYI